MKNESPLDWRGWVFVLLGSVAGGFAAVDYGSQGDWTRAALAGAACAICLGIIAWAIRD